MTKKTTVTTLAKPSTNALAPFAMQERLKIRRDYFPKALQTLVDLLDSPNEQVQLQAAKLIIEHAIGKPAQQVELDAVSNTADGYVIAYRKIIEQGIIKRDPTPLTTAKIVEGEAVTLG